MTTYNKVVSLCEDRGISIYRLEQESQIGNGTIGRWENVNPSIESLKKVAKYFGVPMASLLDDEEDT